MKKILLLILISLNSCAVTNNAQNLDDHLVGKSKEERKEILTKKCIEEAGWTKGGRYHHINEPHIKRMKEICKKLSDEIK